MARIWVAVSGFGGGGTSFLVVGFMGVTLSCCFDFGHQGAQLFAFIVRQVFLFVLVQQIQQVNMAPILQIQEQIPVPASLALTSGRIRAACLANSAESWY